MPKIIMLKGLPASGKSSWARDNTTSGKVIRVNKDELRAMLHNGEYTKGNENEVLRIRDVIIVNALVNNKSIIVDDTNFHPKHEETLRDLARIHSAEFEVKFFDTPLEECIRRDAKRDQPVGKNVILKMWNDYLKPEPPQYNPDLPDCFIVDLDGTLALFEGNPYEREFIYDTVNMLVADMVDMNRYNKHFIILSGRGGQYRLETEQWLAEADLTPDHMWMRGPGDNRADYIVKREMYEEHIKGKYNVAFVIDDRPQIVRLWRSLGLFVFDVNQKGYEF